MTTVFESPNKQRTKSGAAAKAYLKRQRRSELMGLIAAEAEPEDFVRGSQSSLATRIPFVLVLFAILAAGVASVLVLNTMTDESGLRTEKSSATSADLRLDIEQLQAEIAAMDNVPAIAKAAQALGLVPAGDAAMLSVDEHGKATVIGTPTPVLAPGAVGTTGVGTDGTVGTAGTVGTVGTASTDGTAGTAGTAGATGTSDPGQGTVQQTQAAG